MNTVEVRQVDAAGNEGAATTFNFTLDTQAPDAPTVGLSNDTGPSNSDGVTSDGTLAVTPAENGGTLQYSIDGGETWTTSFTAQPGYNSVDVRQIDAAGNEGVATKFNFTLDSQAPAAPTVGLANDTGSSNSDGITNDGTLAVTPAENGGAVQYSIDNGQHWTSSFTAVEGLNTVEVRQVDAAGNEGAPTTFTFTLDTQAPNAPTVGLSKDTGSSNSDRITNNGTLAVTPAEPGGTLQYSVDNGQHWTTGFTAVEGLNTVEVRQVDAAGNEGAATNFSFTFVDLSPTLSPVTGPTYTDTAASDTFNAVTGIFLAQDVDTGTTLTYGIDGGHADNTHSGYDISRTDTYGTLYVNSTTGAYSFVPDNTTINALLAPTTEDFTVTVSDGSLSTHQTYSVTLNGANDTATVGGTTSGAVTEDNNVDPSGHLIADGTLTVHDADTGQASFTAQSSTAGSNGYGTFTLDAAGHWTYSVDNGLTDVQHLNNGDTLTDSFTAISADGSASEVVTVTIHGVNEPTSANLVSSAGVQVSATQYGATNGFVLPGAGNVTTPGTPEDRVTVGYDIGSNHVVLSNDPLENSNQMTPISSSSYTIDGTSYFTSILSAQNGVTMTQTVSLGADANYFTTTIDIYNGSGTDIENVRFMRNIDPDQDILHYNTYDTLNDVLQNPNASSAVAAVQATGPYSGVHVILVGDGADWRASSFGFTNTDPYASSAFDTPQDPNGARGDIAISLTNSAGILHAGEHAKMSFVTTNNVATSGDNALVGTTGADTLNGLGGNDLLYGLAGADTFEFGPGAGHDTVADFNTSEDFLKFDHTLFSDVNSVLNSAHDDGHGNTILTASTGDTVTLDHVAVSQFLAIDHSHILIA